jgi:hypothetical protein
VCANFGFAALGSGALDVCHAPDSDAKAEIPAELSGGEAERLRAFGARLTDGIDPRVIHVEFGRWFAEDWRVAPKARAQVGARLP